MPQRAKINQARKSRIYLGITEMARILLPTPGVLNFAGIEKMKAKILALLTVGLLAGPMAAHAGLLFDNGTTLAPSNPTWNNTYATFEIRDEFVLSSASVIDRIDYSIFAIDASVYERTFLTIYSADGNSILVGIFPVVGSISANGTNTSNINVPNGFDLSLTGLSVNLLAGTYLLGIYTDMTGGLFASIGSGNSGFGNGLLQCFPICEQKSQHMVFSIYGESASVPEPGTLALLGLGLVGMGYARRRKAA